MQDLAAARGQWVALQDIFVISCAVAGGKKVPNIVGFHHNMQPVCSRRRSAGRPATVPIQMSGQLAGKLFSIHVVSAVTQHFFQGSIVWLLSKYELPDDLALA